MKIKYTNIFHDRFIILDDKEIYHLEASLKDLGNKIFAINRIIDLDYLSLIINRLKQL